MSCAYKFENEIISAFPIKFGVRERKKIEYMKVNNKEEIQ